MNAPKLPPCHDLVRLIRPTVEETTFALKEHLTRQPGYFSYELARRIAPFAFSGGLTLTALRDACFKSKNQAERDSNWQAVQAVAAAGSGRVVQCHHMSDGTLAVRKDVSIRVSADFYFVENGKVRVFWLQPRRSFALNDEQLAVFGGLIRLTLLTGDFDGAGLELLDISAPDGRTRIERIFTLDDLPSISDEQVTEGIARVVAAYDEIMAMGIDWGAVRGRRNGRDQESAQDALRGL